MTTLARFIAELGIERRQTTSRALPVWLQTATLCGVAFLLRAGYLFLITRTPGFDWIDPDSYSRRGQLLAAWGKSWHWTTEAVRYSGPFVKAPLYPVFLSMFVASPFGYFWSVAFAHAALGTLAVFALWSLGRDLHSETTGTIAATCYAVYFPALTSANVFMQERVYLPLLIAAFALLARALKEPHDSKFALAGAVLGLAAMARSMPVYFVGPAAALLVLTSDDRRQGVRRGAIFLAAFLVIIVPYSVFVSREVHQLIVVENIAAFGFLHARDEGRLLFLGGAAPTFFQIGRFIWHSACANPIGFLYEKLTIIFGTFQLGGGRWLQVSGGLSTLSEAWAAKISAHVFGDLLLLFAACLGPLGAAFARQRQLSVLLALWILVHLVMTAFDNYGGQRFREPIDWTLLVLASVVVAGQWQRPRPGIYISCLVVALTFGWSALKTVPDSLLARADYGIAPWDYKAHARTTTAEASTGLNVFPVDGRIDLLVKSLDAGASMPVQIKVDGVDFQHPTIDGSGYRFDVPYHKQRAFVEITRLSSKSAKWSVDVFDYPARRGR